MLHRRILVVALPAIVLGWRNCTGSLGFPLKIEVRPFIREARLLFYLDVQPHKFSLIAAMLVDGALRGGTIFLKNKDGFVRPLAVRFVIVIRRWINEHVGDRLHAVGLLRIAHAESGR